MFKTAILMMLMAVSLFAYVPELPAPGTELFTVTVQPMQQGDIIISYDNALADAVSVFRVVPAAGGTVTVNGVVITAPTDYDLNTLPLVNGYRVHIVSVPAAGNRTWINVGSFANVTANSTYDEKFIVDLDDGEDGDSASVHFAAVASNNDDDGGCNLGTGSMSLFPLLMMVGACLIRKRR